MIGRAEIRLADAEIDDVAALRGQRIGARQHREGIFLADAVEGRDGSQHGVFSRFPARALLRHCSAIAESGAAAQPCINFSEKIKQIAAVLAVSPVARAAVRLYWPHHGRLARTRDRRRARPSQRLFRTGGDGGRLLAAHPPAADGGGRLSAARARALALPENPGRFLSGVQVGITLIGILSGAFGGATLGARLGDVLDEFPLIAPRGERDRLRRSS